MRQSRLATRQGSVRIFIPFILDVRYVDVPAGVTRGGGHTGFLIPLLSAVLAFIFLARRIRSFRNPLSTVKSNFVY